MLDGDCKNNTCILGILIAMKNMVTQRYYFSVSLSYFKACNLLNSACKYINQKIALKLLEIFITCVIFSDISVSFCLFICFYCFHIKQTCYSGHSNICKLLFTLTKDLGKVSTSVKKLLNSNLNEIPILVFSSYFYSFGTHQVVRYSLNNNQDRDEPRLKNLYEYFVCHTLLLSASEVFVFILLDFLVGWCDIQ